MFQVHGLIDHPCNLVISSQWKPTQTIFSVTFFEFENREPGIKKDIKFIAVARDTFCYDKGYYMEQIAAGPLKVVLKQYIKLKETQKQDSYGTSSAGAAVTSYGYLPAGGSFYKLIANADMLLERTLEYYLSDQNGGFVKYTKKNVLQLFPQHEDKIKAYLKSHKVDFEKSDDLIRFAGYLSAL